MFVEPADYRPSSLLGARMPDVTSVLGGIGSLALSHALVVGLALLFAVATGHSVLDPRAIGEEPPPVTAPDLPIVEAGFVQLGREWDPRELPDRAIQANLHEARAQDPNVVSAFQRLLTDAGVPPRSQALQALASDDAYENDGRAPPIYNQEGDPSGGDQAREGSMLRGQIETLIRRGLDVPASIAESDYASTTARVRVVVDASWTVSSIEFVSGSGNEDWDRAVRQRVEDIASARPRLNAQPGDEALLNQPLPFAVRPRSGRRRTSGTGTGTGGSSSSSMNLLDALGGGGN